MTPQRKLISRYKYNKLLARLYGDHAEESLLPLFDTQMNWDRFFKREGVEGIKESVNCWKRCIANIRLFYSLNKLIIFRGKVRRCKERKVISSPWGGKEISSIFCPIFLNKLNFKCFKWKFSIYSKNRTENKLSFMLFMDRKVI